MHRDVDALADLGDLAMIVSNERACGGVHARPHRRLWKGNTKRHFAGLANERHQPAHRHHNEVAAFVIAIRTGLAKRSYRYDDQARIEFRAIESPRRKRFDEKVCP